MPAERAIARMRSARAGLEVYRRKIHRLRRLVAGDISALRESREKNNVDDGETTARPFIPELPSILVTTIEDGQSNELLKAIRTLIFQTTYRFPKIEFGDDLTAYEQMANEGYLRKRCASPPFGCGAVAHMQLGLLDYAMGGMGWSYTPMHRGKAVVRSVDTLDMLWDQTAKLPQDIRWAACTWTLPLSEWVAMFGSAKFSKYLAGRDDANSYRMDQPFDLQFYYDLDGESGNYIVFARQGENEYDPTPIIQGSNPCYIDVDGERVPYLPFTSLFFLSLPSVRLPIGLAEGMMPSQIAVWRSESMVQDILDRGRPFHEVNTKKLGDGEIEKWEQDGEIGAWVRTTSDDAIVQKPPLAIPPQLIQYRQHHQQEIIEQSGANPFATGDRVEGVEYAAQVQAIQGAAGLMAGTIAKDNAAFWIETLRKVLAKGKAYDRRPVSLRIDGEELMFDESDPINQYLRPDAEIIIREDTLAFRPRDQEIQEAKFMLDTAVQLGQMFPAAIAIAFEELLRARGERNPQRWMQAPQAPGGMPIGA